MNQRYDLPEKEQLKQNVKQAEEALEQIKENDLDDSTYRRSVAASNEALKLERPSGPACKFASENSES
jgi:benzoyl-CoA reductase/2-hydroxyglutaryl-CoA dehydratase subunit BcrC/BadD/HgdB